MTWQITHQAGVAVIPRVSTHFLVATHVFLELLHYLVWVVVIPLTGKGSTLWRTRDVPLARRSPTWRRLIATVIAAGAVVMLLFRAAFPIPTCRALAFRDMAAIAAANVASFAMGLWIYA